MLLAQLADLFHTAFISEKQSMREYVVPLLPLIFEALKSTVEDEIRDSAECTQEEMQPSSRGRRDCIGT
jgi:hypothetical protein